MDKLSPHAQYVKDLTCLGLTWADGGPDQELVASALKHTRSHTCAMCKGEVRHGVQNSGEECVLRASEDSNGHTGATKELIDAINAKYGATKVRGDGAR